MAEKVKFDQETLSFVETESKAWRITKIILGNLFMIIFFGIFFFIVFSYLIQTPEEQKLKNANKRLEQEYKILLKRFIIAQENLNKIQKTDNLIYQAIFKTKPIEEKQINYDSLINSMSLEDLISSNSKQLDNLIKQAQKGNNEFEKLFEQIDKEKLKKIPAILPVSIEQLANGFYGYGLRLDLIYKTVKLHTGVDIPGSEDVNVYATADGIVKYPERNKVYGKNIKIDHQNGFYTIYANLSQINVRIGQKVKRGDIIGKIGNTGKSYSPHLHYEVRYKNKYLDPIYFFFGSINPKIYDILQKNSNQMPISFD